MIIILIAYMLTYSPRWLAWSQGRLLPDAECAFIKWTGCTLQWLCRNDSTI